ncbi:MAG TPA: BioF/Kbl family PLP-dependent acyltransferase [Deinococcales bacterium]|nr:BioF/Kbl family PLP-dependent acyltransferase [Deinococcales bacterium]
MPTTLMQRVTGELDALDASGLRIHPKVLASAQAAHTTLLTPDGPRNVVNFASNNYLGFADHPALKARARAYLEEWGVGSGAVRTIAGTLGIHEAFERQLAEFKGTPAALTLPSGFTANQGVLGGILKEGDAVFSDELNHASIIDGLRLTRAQRFVWKHKDVNDLRAQLAAHPTDGLALVVTDGVFSMDGDIAPLGEVVAAAREFGATVYVDDAHGSGVLGHDGRGTVHHFGLQDAEDVIQVGTLSKAWAGIGGYVAGTAELRDLLINRARPFLFSTSAPPAVLGGLSAALDLVREDPSFMQRLWDNTRYFKAELARQGWDTLASETPITPVLFGEERAAFEASRRLLEEGIFAVALGFPTVPHGRARIRNIVTAEHSREDLDQALEGYARLKRAGL